MTSVARQVLAKLHDRLLAINGTGDFVHDVGGRVRKRRPTIDVEAEALPAIFITRRNGGDDRELALRGPKRVTKITVTFDVVGVVPIGDDSADTAEDLLADIERALERDADPYLSAGGDGSRPFLLRDEMQLVGAQYEIEPTSNVDVVAVGVQCVLHHYYGEPDRLPP